LIYKAKYRLNEPINRKLMKTICEINSNYHDDLCSLNEHFNFLKQLRDLYRLIVFAGNELQPEYLEPAARIMGYNDDQNGAATENLVRDYYKCTKETNQIVERLIAELVE